MKQAIFPADELHGTVKFTFNQYANGRVSVSAGGHIASRPGGATSEGIVINAPFGRNGVPGIEYDVPQEAIDYILSRADELVAANAPVREARERRDRQAGRDAVDTAKALWDEVAAGVEEIVN